MLRRHKDSQKLHTFISIIFAKVTNGADMNDSTQEPSTAREAAERILQLIPQGKNNGLNYTVILNTGDRISLNPLDIATLQGGLKGITEGRIFFGDARLHGCIIGITNALREASKKYSPLSNDAATNESEAKDTTSQDSRSDHNKRSLEEINIIASRLMGGLYLATRFGFTQDKMPLTGMVEEKGIGFGTEPGPTGGFTSRVR